MRLRALTFAIVGALAVAPTALTRSPGPAFAIGNGHAANEHFRFGAFALPGSASTHRAEGHATFWATKNGVTKRVDLRVTCLRTRGTVATVGGILTTSRGAVLGARLRAAFFYVRDTGQTGPSDRISRVFKRARLLVRCPRPNPRQLAYRVREGDLVVDKG